MTGFYDFDFIVGGTVPYYGERVRVTEWHRLTGLPKGSTCIVFPKPDSDSGQWLRRTSNGADAGVRYESFSSLDEALTAGVTWARRKERERDAEARGRPVRGW